LKLCLTVEIFFLIAFSLSLISTSNLYAEPPSGSEHQVNMENPDMKGPQCIFDCITYFVSCYEAC